MSLLELIFYMHLESPNFILITDRNIVAPPTQKNTKCGSIYILNFKIGSFTLFLFPSASPLPP